jgi:RHS repeat-associated protein
MKKIFLLSFLLLQTLCYSQNQDELVGGVPVKGIIPIKGTIDASSSKEEATIVSKSSSNAKIVTAPTGSSPEVGITDGSLSVSLSGAANYSIPIEVPPGINGVVPQISLEYSSQGDNGIAGYGWNVGGVSGITRIPATMYHDGVIDAVDFDNLDRFALDGQRLILKSGNYGGDGAVYETENYSNLKISSHGVSTFGAKYGPSYFLVQYPDGSSAAYGLTSTSGYSRTEWSISYWQNSQGVRIDYSYTNKNNELILDAIYYGANGANSISFSYRQRERPEIAYVAGEISARNNLLQNIAVKANNTGFRNYLITYESTFLGYQKIKSITEKSGDLSKSYNPTVFTYEDTPEKMVYLPPVTANLTVSNINLLNSATVSGDYNGDGKMDFIFYPTIGANTKKLYSLFDDLDNPAIDYNMGSTHEVGAFQDIFTVSWIRQDGKRIPRQGWCVVQEEPTTKKISFNTYTAGAANPVVWQGKKEYTFPKYETGFYENCDRCIGCEQNKTNLNQQKYNQPIWVPIELDINKRYINGDFNGDGLTDVVAVEKAVSYYNVTDCGTYEVRYAGGKSYFINLDNRTTADDVNESGYLRVKDDSKILVADFDGDGIDEIFVFEIGFLRIYTLNKNKQFIEIYANATSDPDLVLNKTILLGDYNGDGKTDFMMAKGQTDYFAIYKSTGIGFSKGDIKGPPNIANTTDDTFHLIANDFNNDGKTDIGFVQTSRNVKNANGFISASIYKNMDNKFVEQFYPYAYSGVQAAIKAYPIPIFLNSNQPNQNLEMALISDNKIHRFKSSKDFGKEKLIKTITTGNGVTQNIIYSPLVQNIYDENQVYLPNGYITETYPNLNIQKIPSMQVVSQLEMHSKDTFKKQLHSYYSAVTNVDGRGFLGFKKILRTNWFNDELAAISSISEYDQEKRGAMIESYTVLGEIALSHKPPYTFLSKTTQSYEHELSTSKVFKIKSIASTTENTLDNTAIATTTEYDTYNNPIVTTATVKNGSTPEQTTITYYNYINEDTPSNYYIGRLKDKNITVTDHVNADTKTAEKVYEYNSNHLISQLKTKGDNTDYVTEDFTYDDYGNVTNKTVSAPGTASRTLKYEYEAGGQYLKSMTDIEELETKYEIDPNTGWLKSETNPYNLQTSYKYDAWGKNIETKDYLDNISTIKYTRDGAGTIVSSFPADGSESIVKLDDLGREIVMGNKNVDDSWSYTTTKYDAYNRVVKVGEPENSINLEPLQSTTTKYDEYGRVTEVAEYTGKTTSMVYDKLSTTTSCNDGRTPITTVKNAVRTVKTNIDEGGAVNFKYDATGNLSSSGFEGNLVTMTYDGWGRKTSLNDPSAGNYTYSYNGLGELVSETTPNGTSYYTLDDTGKVLKKKITGTNTDSETNYTYDPASKLLISKNHNDRNLYSEVFYTYDGYKRLLSNSETDAYQNFFSKNVEYDNLGRIKKEKQLIVSGWDDEQYATTEVENSYKNGYHHLIKDVASGKTLWEIQEVNARGQAVHIGLGENIRTRYEYDDFGFQKLIHTYAGPNANPVVAGNVAHKKPSVITKLEYTFEPLRGNLKNRTYNLFNWNEDFEYDTLDRLTQYTNTREEREIQTYDNKGRITQNLMGSYQYRKKEKNYQNTSIDTYLTSSYYKNREGIFSDGMEDKKEWGKVNHPGDGIVFYTYDTKKAYTGARSLKFTNTTSTIQYAHSDKWIPIRNSQDTEYTISAWVYSNNVAEVGLLLFMGKGNEGMNIDPNLPFDHITTNTVAGQWIQISKTITVPAATTKLNLRLDNNTQGEVWFDDVKIIRSDYTSPLRNLNITYNAFKAPTKIEEPGIDNIEFFYNDNNQRSYMSYGEIPNSFAKKYYKYYSEDGTMEIKHNTVMGISELTTYIGGNAYTAPLMLRTSLRNQEYLYLHRDYQGSILAVSNQEGTVLEKRIFDAWGNIIKVEDGEGNLLDGLTLTDRGYTGHEHIQSVGLINMNGRLYDPKIHRFLQPDNYVQDPYNTQNYNRYAYVMNNPTKYSDPDGEQYNNGRSTEVNPNSNPNNCPDCGANLIKAIFDFFKEKDNRDWVVRNFNSAISDIGDAGTAVGKYIVGSTGSSLKYLEKAINDQLNKHYGGGGSKTILSQDSSSGSGASGGGKAFGNYSWGDFKYDYTVAVNRAERKAEEYGQPIARFMAEFHPGVGLANAYKGFTEGTNIYGESLSKSGASLQGAMALVPLLKVGKLAPAVANGGTSVLGHYPDYVKLAESLGARRFQIPQSIWNKMSTTQQWKANSKFLDRMILRGDNIRLATPLNQVKKNSWYAKELEYLYSKGYKASSDGLWLIK